MSSVFEIGGLAGWALLAGPLIVLGLVLLMTLLWPYRLRPAETAQAAGTASPPAPEKTVAPALLADQEVAELSGLETAEEAVGIPATEVALKEAPEPRPKPAPEPPETSQARAMIDSALRQRAAGDSAAAAENLRGAIVIASNSGDRKLHAAARLELGDIAEADGDLQTACEHWQLARSLFEEEQSPADASKCEQRMDTNGCPTDWVLNDF